MKVVSLKVLKYHNVVFGNMFFLRLLFFDFFQTDGIHARDNIKSASQSPGSFDYLSYVTSSNP